MAGWPWPGHGRDGRQLKKAIVKSKHEKHRALVTPTHFVSISYLAPNRTTHVENLTALKGHCFDRHRVKFGMTMKLGGADASEEAPCRENTWQNSKLVISISWEKIWYCAATWYTKCLDIQIYPIQWHPPEQWKLNCTRSPKQRPWRPSRKRNHRIHTFIHWHVSN